MGIQNVPSFLIHGKNESFPNYRQLQLLLSMAGCLPIKGPSRQFQQFFRALL